MTETDNLPSPGDMVQYNIRGARGVPGRGIVDSVWPPYVKLRDEWHRVIRLDDIVGIDREGATDD